MHIGGRPKAERDNGNGFPRRRLIKETDLDAALLMLVGPAAKAITGMYRYHR